MNEYHFKCTVDEIDLERIFRENDEDGSFAFMVIGPHNALVAIRQGANDSYFGYNGVKIFKNSKNSYSFIPTPYSKDGFFFSVQADSLTKTEIIPSKPYQVITIKRKAIPHWMNRIKQFAEAKRPKKSRDKKSKQCKVRILTWE